MLKKVTYILLLFFCLSITLQAQDFSVDSTEQDSSFIIVDYSPPKFHWKVGLGLGGSNIAGVDFEIDYLSKYINLARYGCALQVGVGLYGFSAGVNRFVGNIGNNSGSLKAGLHYRYTGFGRDDVWGHSTSNLGPVIIYQYRWFTVQAGAGYIFERGEAYKGADDRKIQFHAGVGVRLPKY